LFLINYPLPNLPPRGKEWINLFPLGGNKKGGKSQKKKLKVSLILDSKIGY
jgi:hypothetical protein